MENDMPDVYVAHTVPIRELVYANSYQELFRKLEDKYGLECVINEDGDICYMIDCEYTPKKWNSRKKGLRRKMLNLK